LAGLYAVSRCNFLVFHCLTEAFSIIIASAVFALFWNTRRFLESGVYLVVGLGCLFGGLFDLIYVFAYPGMTVFPGAGGDLALQGKTVAQWYVSLSCVGAFPFLRRKVQVSLALFVYGAAAAIALASIFYWRVFPHCYVAGVGITAFERLGLVLSCSAYLTAVVLLFHNRREFDGYVFKCFAAILIVFFVQDFAGAVATDLAVFARTIAHLCQIVALFFVYKAFVEVGLTRPYDLLFRRRQQAAEALEREQQFLQAVLDNVQSGIAACDADGVLTLFNRALQDFHGLPQEPIPAEQWAEHYDLYHADGKTRMAARELPLVRALRGERFHDLEMRIVPKTAPARSFLASAAPLPGADGQPRGAVVVLHDVTELKRAQEIVRLAHDEALQRHQAELAHVARLSVMGELAASLAHELNQPLHAVTNYAYGCICRLQGMPGRDQELILALEQINNEANRAAEIIRRIRAFVQKRKPQFGGVPVNDLIRGTLVLAQTAIERCRARVGLELAEGLPAVSGDPVEIEQVVMNLVLNGLEAMDQTPEPSRLLRIKTWQRDKQTVQVDVCDGGQGIRAEDGERIFEPFFSTKPEGMGMGLAISRSIIQAHAGRLWATANEPRGSAFHFTLPVSEEHDP
jgi:PAS domain S-box-containing protein